MKTRYVIVEDYNPKWKDEFKSIKDNKHKFSCLLSFYLIKKLLSLYL